MPWFKLDDGFHCHPKVMTAGNAAIGLYVRCGTYCSHQLTDGLVPGAIARSYGTRTEIKNLVDTNLFEREGSDYRIHDYLDYNPSAEQVRAERAAAAERQRRARQRATSQRDSRRDNNRDRQRESHDSHTTSHGPPDPTRPDPVSKPPPQQTVDRAKPDTGGGLKGTAKAIATAICDQQPAGTIHNRTAWINAKTAEITAAPISPRHIEWLDRTNPDLDPDKRILALAARHEDGRWPQYIQPDPNPPDAWKGLNGDAS